MDNEMMLLEMGITLLLRDFRKVVSDQLHQFVDRHHQGLFYCTLCEKTAATRRDVRNHVESIHYPNAFAYNCQFCGKTLKTKKARDWHMSKNHKDLNIKGITSVAGLF